MKTSEIIEAHSIAEPELSWASMIEGNQEENPICFGLSFGSPLDHGKVLFRFL